MNQFQAKPMFSLYAQDVMGYDQVASAQVGMVLLFIRPVIGVLIGILADRTQITFWLLVSFIVSFLGAILFATSVSSKMPCWVAPAMCDETLVFCQLIVVGLAEH